jgi:type IV pilus assembly protein PilY1
MTPSINFLKRLLHIYPLRAGTALVLAGVALTLLFVAKAAPSFSPGSQPTGWITRSALSSNNLSSNNEVIYRPNYVRSGWYGKLEANSIDKDGSIGGNSPWTNKDAGVLLDSQNYDSGRKIVTLKSDGTKIPFRWGNLSNSQQSALVSEKVLKYVRGDRSNEAPNGDDFRTRNRVLGDIIHSTLVHWDHGNDNKRLYVGANDGMLHAFDAATGAELFAYIPSLLIPKLPQLRVTPYAHTYYVDGPISVADVRLGTATHTLLTGGLGAGGKGLYALDVTTTTATAAISSEAVAASKIKWEISSDTTGFANLGYTYAMPRLRRLNSGAAAVIVGNGYMNSGSGSAALYVINADTGAKIAEIDTGDGNAASPNGLSSPTTVDTDGNGTADYAYAGDLNGNMWKFNLTSATPSSFSVSKLFTASPTAAITTAPVVQRHPNGGYMVAFGTGRTLAPSDITDKSVHYVYGIWDGAPSVNTALLGQTLTEVVHNGAYLRTASTNTATWTASAANGHRGWQLALPAGERGGG